jgi:ribonuclease HI
MTSLDGAPTTVCVQHSSSGYQGAEHEGPMKVFINTDGAARPPIPGPAGAGFVILFEGDAGWDSVVGAIALHGCSHHEAEYEAAIQALKVASELGATEALVRCDSLVMVQQVNDEAQVRVPRLIRLAERLRAEIQKFDSFEIVWVGRRKNKTADLLSKVGLSKADLALEAAG